MNHRRWEDRALMLCSIAIGIVLLVGVGKMLMRLVG